MNFNNIPLEKMNQMNSNTLMEVLGIEYVEAGENYICASMPVDKRTHQPMGLLHGGASATLVETIGSLGSAMICDLSIEYPVGLEVNTNHIGGVKEGKVIGKGLLVHQGKKTHVWQVDIREEISQRMIATGRLTVMIIQK
jgi:1,4-dihydroxy-2-naphthoyl-CoA hydrolase